MSDIKQPMNPAAPASAPSTATGPTDGAADVYRRAVEARPTGFTENPIGAMASAVDRMGAAATRMLSGRGGAGLEGRDGLAQAETDFKAASEAVRNNPDSLPAKQGQLVAGLRLLRDMQGLAPNDPRRVKVAGFVVQLANKLGKNGIPGRVSGLDVRGLLRAAAGVVSKYGDAKSMQAAFELESTLRATLGESPEAALKARDALMDRLGLSKSATQTLLNSWSVRLVNPGEMPSLDIDSRQMAIDASKDNPSLSVLARAWWHDNALNNPADKDGFMAAFLKIANQGGFTSLSRKYKELRRMARLELSHSRQLQTIGTSSDAPVMAAVGQRGGDESGDMFAALAVFSKSPEGQSNAGVPAEMLPVLKRFYS
ncbi:MAG: hypothetical protein H7123_09660 [Thermoleophilia bacterium]|nr:hypothetical protein [Thermoleophilia bacterium]